MVSTIDYHLHELQIARDSRDPARSMPSVHSSELSILDVGCGAGQTLISTGLEGKRRLVGVDVDREALVLGRSLSDAIEFVNAPAECLPFAGSSFDLVISRVALPYTDIPVALRETARVLKPSGRCWIVLHPVSMGMRDLSTDIRRAHFRGVLFRLYVLVNALLLHALGRVIRYPLGHHRMESVQTARGIRRALLASGFQNIKITQGRHLTVEARLSAT